MTADPPITDGLRAWVWSCVDARLSLRDIVHHMCESGWTAEPADRVARAILREGRAEPAPPPREIPRLGADGRSELRAGRKRVRVLLTMERPQLTLLGGVLSAKECRELIEEARADLIEARVREAGETGTHPTRISQSCYLDKGSSPLVRKLEERAQALLGWPAEATEPLQVQYYSEGGEYKPHYDFFDEPVPSMGGDDRPRQRVATLILYLHTPDRGGSTVFVDPALEVRPAPGDGLFFAYPVASPDSGTLHGGGPVLAGEKWIATFWFRERLPGDAA